MYIKIDDKKHMEYQTDLRPIFNVIKEYIENMVWLISFHEFQYLDRENFDNRLNTKKNLIRLSGKELVEIIEKNKIQFIWGVLSGCKDLPVFEKLDIDNKLSLKNYGAEAYVYDDAEIEIDCFDSTFTIIRTENKPIMDKLSVHFESKINFS